jgi:zinc and cadmium transporter
MMLPYFLLIVSVLLGTLIVSFFPLNKQIVRLLLSFSGAYLLATTITHLLPEVYLSNAPHSDGQYIGAFILAGILLQSILESFSKGAEHGHIHTHSNSEFFPWLLFVSLSIHAFSEGIPLSYEQEPDLLWAICIHKIPIGIVLATFLLNTKLKKTQGYLFVMIFALMSPLGVLLSQELTFFIHYQREITAATIGVLLHVSTIILFESTENHKFNYSKFISILTGIGMALLV